MPFISFDDLFEQPMEAERDKVNPFEVIIWMNVVNAFIQTVFWFYLFLLILLQKGM